MTKRTHDGADKPLADQRAAAGQPVEEAGEPDFAEEHAPSETDPPNAEAQTPGGEDEGYQPHTRL